MIADMVRIQRLTGMRPGELLQMTVADLDRTDPECWVYRPGHHKTEHHGRGRMIFIGPRAIEILERRIQQTGGDVLPIQAKPERLFSISSDNYRQALLRACDRAKVPHWSPNRLRHAMATEVRKAFGLEAAQVLLGHSRADVTQTYAERDMKKGQDVARKIG
jgi:integrase